MPNINEYYLQPGDLVWEQGYTRLKTILGSCVAICLWHEENQEGAMAHCLLPHKAESASLQTRYISHTMLAMMQYIKDKQYRADEFVAKLFGGGYMYESQSELNIGQLNIEAARTSLNETGIPIIAEHVGGHGHRNLIFDLWTGKAWLKQFEPFTANLKEKEKTNV